MLLMRVGLMSIEELRFDRFEKFSICLHARARVCSRALMDALDKFLELGLALDLFFDHGDHLEESSFGYRRR